MTLRIYTEISHYESFYRQELIDLLKPFVGKENGYSDQDRLVEYDAVDFGIEISNSIENSDWAILPMSWNYYLENKKQNLAFDFIRKAQVVNKKVLSWMSGDFGVKAPHFKNVVILRQSASLFVNRRISKGMPVFILDPLKYTFNDYNIYARRWDRLPIIGFCGQTDSDIRAHIKDSCRILFRNIAFFTRLSLNEPQSIYPSVRLRETCLSILESSKDISTNFIRRRQYRAGAKDKNSLLNTSLEYFNNIRSSDYVLCARGGGNFSARLYETLAMGRIPIYINTNGLLPLDGIINWKNHMVWVEKNEINKLEEKILTFHEKLRGDDFIKLQLANRKLWETHLRIFNFYARLLDFEKNSNHFL